eukprot:CAMPEP_0116903408 /NCGR_PEP_ID=MMETSP0467-20121206/10720_1 /TAXON_ID=283647 /ORGANISM="Mesodinium pulex, Strain SPMC105" /LENGTH=90 /DNA_ID=CAMNT_0004577685 /DNA_START=2046 /DNA_END=2318 /DNA_ORIENTATION=-
MKTPDNVSSINGNPHGNHPGNKLHRNSHIPKASKNTNIIPLREPKSVRNSILENQDKDNKENKDNNENDNSINANERDNNSTDNQLLSKD